MHDDSHVSVIANTLTAQKDSIGRGAQAEELVVNILKQQKFSILAQNYRKFYGEIDIIASKADILSFVEVKTRTNPRIAMETVISLAKQRKLALVARSFLATHNITDKVCRFDVALVEQKQNSIICKYIPNAFTISDG